jgi:hypothetical protein
VLIGRAVRAGWDVSQEKRATIIRQLIDAIHGDDVRLCLAAAAVLVEMVDANTTAEQPAG